VDSVQPAEALEREARLVFLYEQAIGDGNAIAGVSVLERD
jgi:hypothetical protein